MMKRVPLAALALIFLTACAANNKRPLSWVNPSYSSVDESNKALNLAISTCSMMSQAMNPETSRSTNYSTNESSSGFSRGFARGQAIGESIAMNRRAASVRNDFEKCLNKQGWTPVYE